MTNVGDCRHLSQGPSNSYFLQAIPPSSFPTKLAIYITNNSIRISNHCFHCWILFVGLITSMAIRKWLLTPHKKRHQPINYHFSKIHFPWDLWSFSFWTYQTSFSYEVFFSTLSHLSLFWYMIYDFHHTMVG